MLRCDSMSPDRQNSAPIERLLDRRREFQNFLRKRVSSQEDVEEILQSAFARAIEKGDGLRDEETIVAWFYRILRNAVVDYYRSNSSRDRVLQAWPEGLDPTDDRSVLLKTDVCECINAMLAELKPEYAEALKRVDIEERPITQLALEKKITSNNATVRVHRAREALRKKVLRACGVCAEHKCVDCQCTK